MIRNLKNRVPITDWSVVKHTNFYSHNAAERFMNSDDYEQAPKICRFSPEKLYF